MAPNPKQPQPPIEPVPTAPAVLVPIAGSARTPLPEIDADLIRRIKQLTPGERAQIRQDAGLGGIIPGGSRVQPDGSVQVTISVGVDCIEQIRTWAEEAGKGFEEQVQELVDFLLIGYLNGEWMAQPAASVAAAAAAAVPAAVPAAK